MLLTLAASVLAITLLLRIAAWAPTDQPLLDTTPAALGIWVAAQSEEESPRSLLGQLAREQALREGVERLPKERVLSWARTLLLLAACLHVAASMAALLGMMLNSTWCRPALILALLLTMAWLFVLPPGEQNKHLLLILPGSFALLLALMLLPGPATKTLGFVLIITILLLGVQSLKLFAASRNYRITTMLEAWRYTTMPDLDAALEALESGELDAVMADRRVLRDIVAPKPADPDIDPATSDWPALRYLTRFDSNDAMLGILPVTPRYPGRLALATRADSPLTSLRELQSLRTGVVAGDFAETNYLAQERRLVLLDMKILNDVNLPHLQQITKALLQPARRNGPLLLLRILIEAAGHTWSEALYGFLFGASLGFVLGTVFAHFGALERGLLPYVVASQDRAHSRHCANGRYLAGRRLAFSCGHRCLSDLLSGHHQHLARPAFAPPHRLGADEFLGRQPLANHVEVALSGRAALSLHRAQGLRDCQRGWRHHRRIAFQHP